MAQVVLPPQQDALGQLHQLMTLKEAMDTRKLREFQLSEAQRKAAENINFDKAIQQGGTDEEITGKMRSAGAEPYMTWMKHLSSLGETENRRQVEHNNLIKGSLDILSDRLSQIAEVEDPDDQKKVYANVRQSAIDQNIPLAKMLLPEQFDPAHIKELVGASKFLEASNKALDFTHKKAAETRAQAEEQRKIDAEQRAIETHRLAMQGDTETQHFNNIYLPGALEEKGIHPPMVPTKTDVEQAYGEFKRIGSSSKDTDTAHYAELFKLVDQKKATPDQILELKGLQDRLTRAGANTINMNEANKEAQVPDLEHEVQTTMSGRQYLDTSQYQGDAKTRIIKAASDKGIPVVNKDTADMLSEIDTAHQNLRYMLSTIESKLPKDASGRLLKGPANKLESLMQTDPELASMGTYRNAAIQAMRAVAGAKGLRINRQEIQLAIDNDIPQMSDTLDTARHRLKDLETFLDSAEKTHLVKNRTTLNSTSGTSLDDQILKAMEGIK